MVRLGVEGDGNAAGAVGREVITGYAHAHVVGSALVGVVAQSLHLVVAVVVGSHLHGNHVGRVFLGGRHRYHHIGNAGSVGEAHIAIYHTRLHAVAFYGVGVVVGESLAIVHRAHAVVVGVNGRCGFILIFRFADVGGNGLPVFVAVFGSSLHLKVVDGQPVGFPLQQHALLQLCPVEGGQHLARCFKVVVAAGEGVECKLGKVDVFAVFKGFRHLKTEVAVVV